MSNLRIHVYTVCYNEEEILSYFLRHYSSFAEKIIVFDNYSTDTSPEIVRSCPIADLRRFDTDGTFNELENIRIKNKAYKESLGKADFVIVVDTDEFLYHHDMLDLLKRYRAEGVTLPKTIGYEMISWRFPKSNKPLVENIRIGHESPSYAKRCIFHPEVDINFQVGAHTCNPRGNIVESSSVDIKVLHYHYLGMLRIIRKHRSLKKKLSQFNLEHKLSYQFTWGAMRLVGRFLVYRANSYDTMRNKASIVATTMAPWVNALVKYYWSDDRDKRWNY
jgi:glycosyltransferase involved in cell wall biosynthesis